MAIAILCPCGKRFQVHDQLAGKRVKCVGCGKPVLVTTAAAATPAAEEDDDPDSDVLVSEPRQDKPPAGTYSGIAVDDHLQDEASGNLTVDWVVYAKNRPFWPAVGIGAIAITALLAVVFHWSFGIVSLLCAAATVWGAMKVRRHFSTGHIQPAAVIQLQPPLVAVMANLSRTEGRVWRYMKIVAVPSLEHILGEKPRLGMRLAAVSKLCGPADHEHWMDFSPELVHSITRSPKQISAALATLTPQQWKRMEFALRTIPRPLSPGMYRVLHYRPGSGSGFEARTLAALVQKFLAPNPTEARYGVARQIPPNLLRNATEEIGPGVTNDEILALIRADDDAEGKYGVIVTKDSLRFRLAGNLRSDIQWPDLWGVGLSEDALEVVFRPGFRMRLPVQRIRKNVRRLEAFLTAVAESP